jgi:hypothetical protein
VRVRPTAEAKTRGRFTVREEQRNGHPVVRLSGRGVQMLMPIEDVFDLAELLDDLCDEIEDRDA